ncbi:MAG: hypothetical protein Q7K41_02975 [Dehalococcoidales bacterium]|nr:hypothetical protein [Dehalococcoidales bacterium]
MSRRCAFKGCFAPELSCSNGEFKLEDCPHWTSGAESVIAGEEQDNAAAVSGEFRFPWTGNAMGAADLNYLAGAATTRLLTMAGAADAGKTSLLAAFYLLLARGLSPEGIAFSGSLTLEGWENIASNLRWSSQHGPSFPPHTSSGAGRRPGLLHLSLRTPTKLHELLAADAPGEWFSEWATNKQAPQADGARWLADCSDVILVIADSQALASPQRGLARKSLVDLLRRVGGELRGRPVALVWTKCDIAVPADIVTTIHEAANRSLIDYTEFRVSMHPAENGESQNQGRGILELLHWVLTAPSKGYELQTVEAPEWALLRTFGKF